MTNKLNENINYDKRYCWNTCLYQLAHILKFDYYSKKKYRVSSSGYIKKKFIREYIFKKYDNKCFFCNSKLELQIDHIKSVSWCYENKMLFECNHIDNLRLLCSKCNIKKSTKNG